MYLSDLHSFINYFSIGVLCTGIIFEMIGRAGQKEPQIIFGWNAIRIGIILLTLSVITGLLVESSVYISRDAATGLLIHKIAAITSFVLVLAMLGFRLLFQKKMSSADGGAALRGAYICLQIVVLAVILTTSFIGMRLVKGLGVGVEPYEKIERYMPPPVNVPEINKDTTEYLQ